MATARRTSRSPRSPSAACSPFRSTVASLTATLTTSSRLFSAWWRNTGSRMAKRSFDATAALLGILALAPLLLLIALLVRLTSRGPILFKQERVGLGGRSFLIYKFRTMRVQAEKSGQLTVGRDPRVTPVGQVLRDWKLDELPQLFNVLKGEMSLVGPRPEVPRYVARYDGEQRKVLSVRPGITDLASIEFRDENALLAGRRNPELYYLERIMPRKLELNLEYVRRQHFWFDLRIIFLTVWRVISPRREAPALQVGEREHVDA